MGWPPFLPLVFQPIVLPPFPPMSASTTFVWGGAVFFVGGNRGETWWKLRGNLAVIVIVIVIVIELVIVIVIVMVMVKLIEIVIVLVIVSVQAVV